EAADVVELEREARGSDLRATHNGRASGELAGAVEVLGDTGGLVEVGRVDRADDFGERLGDGRKAHLLALLGREGLRVDNGVVEQDLDLRDDLIARIDVEGDVNLVGDVVEVHRDVRGT